ncbi:MAG TPA: response regulator transcription factor, partial [Chitinophagales bacterium]|nr:response regulator transcription factor [Chitinophagales bacterium]
NLPAYQLFVTYIHLGLEPVRMSPMLKVLAVDDHQFFLNGLRQYLDSLPFVERVETCSNYSDFRKKIKKQAPDIVLLDLNLPGYDGFKICGELTQNYPDTVVAILTQYDDEKMIEKARLHGASAYLIKNSEPEVIGDFLLKVKNGELDYFFVNNPVPIPLNNFRNTSDAFELKQVLSPREREVMLLLVRGNGHDEVGKILGISYETVKTHRQNILTKMKVRNVAELILLSVKHKLTDEN